MEAEGGEARHARLELPGGRRAGPHLPLGLGLLRIPERAARVGASALQLFSDNPTAWHRRAELPSELPAFRVRLAELDVSPLVLHAPYLVNLAGPIPELVEKSVDLLAHELSIAPLYGARFVNVHAGSHRGTGVEAGVNRLVDGIEEVFGRAAASEPLDGKAGPARTGLTIENSAGGGDTIGVTIEELAQILEAAAARKLDACLSFCLDTAHLWGAGYDVSNEAGVGALVTRIGSLLGRERIVMLHLNDSRTVRGSLLDRHEHIAAGEVGPDGMRELLTEPWLATLPAFLETPGMDLGYDRINLERARMLIDGETPPGLPPEAFEVRSSRSRTAPPSS